MYALGMTTATTDKTVDLNSLRRLGNPKERLTRAAAAITTSEREHAQRALRRNAAAVLLFRDGQTLDPPMKPAEMWRDTIVVSRSLWHKIADEADPGRLDELTDALQVAVDGIQAADADGDAVELVRLAREADKIRRKLGRHRAQLGAIDALEAEVAGVADRGGALRQVAKEESVAARALEFLIGDLMKLRDEVAITLMDGTHGEPVSNADVARMTKLSTARVAQLRQLR